MGYLSLFYIFVAFSVGQTSATVTDREIQDLQRKADAARANLPQKIEAIEAELQAKLQEIDDEYQAKIQVNKRDAKLQARLQEIDDELQAKLQEIDDEHQAKIQVNKREAELQARLQEIDDELQAKLQEIDDEHQAKIQESIKGRLNYKARLQEIDDELQAKLQEIDDEHQAKQVESVTPVHKISISQNNIIVQAKAQAEYEHNLEKHKRRLQVEDKAREENWKVAIENRESHRSWIQWRKCFPFLRIFEDGWLERLENDTISRHTHSEWGCG